MSLEHELPQLLAELADDHVVREPPTFEPGRAEWSGRDHRSLRSARFTIVAVAACSVVLIGGLVAIGAFNDDAAPSATSAPAPDTSRPSLPESSTSALAVTASPSVDLIGIEAQSGSVGTTGVVLVFDGDLPTGDAVPVDDVAFPPPDQVGYATQFSLDTPVSVCGDTHWFPSPGNPIVDVYVPSDWFDPAALIDPPTAWAPDGGPPTKIIVCEPMGGTVQISIWGSVSARMEDISVNVVEKAITIDIVPDPALVAAETAETPPTPQINPLAQPLVAITGEGDAVYVLDDVSPPVLIYDGANTDGSPALGDGPNAVDRVAYAAAEDVFVVSLCCSPVVGQVITARPDELPMPAGSSPPKDQMGEDQLVFDGYQYAPALDPDGERQVSIVGEGRGIYVIDAAADTFANVQLPDESGDLWDLVWNESGINILGRTEATWTLTTANYADGQIELGATRNFALLAGFEDLRFAGTAVEGEIAMHDLRTDTILSGTIDDYGNNNGDERGSSLQVIALPAAALSAWFHDPGQLIWVDTNRTLRVGDRVISGQYTWARR